MNRRGFFALLAGLLAYAKSFSPEARAEAAYNAAMDEESGGVRVFADNDGPVGDGSGSSWANACALDDAIAKHNGSGATIYVRGQADVTIRDHTYLHRLNFVRLREGAS